MLRFYCLKCLNLALVNIYFFSPCLFLPSPSLSLLPTLNLTELTVPVCTKLHDAGLFWSPWERSVVVTTSSVQNSLTRWFPRTYTGTERSATGRYQCHQRQIPEPKWSMAFLPTPTPPSPMRIVKTVKIVFPFLMCILVSKWALFIKKGLKHIDHLIICILLSNNF